VSLARGFRPLGIRGVHCQTLQLVSLHAASLVPSTLDGNSEL
jgi:hypothetical protein